MKIDIEVPNRFYDLKWMNTRKDFLNSFNSAKKDIFISFETCEWIDLQPLNDLFLQTAISSMKGKNVIFILSQKRLKIYSKVHRFLIDSGFFRGFLGYEWGNNITTVIEKKSFSIEELLNKVDTMYFQSRALDFETVIPLCLINTREFKNRSDVFKFCHELREEYISKGKDNRFGIGRAKTLKIPVGLISEFKIFFNSILAELIDNVRIHKNETNSHCSLYIRVRKRIERYTRARIEAEPSWDQLTIFKKNTSFLWSSDIIEAVFSDSGNSIQDTYIEGWKNIHAKSQKKVPRLPDGKRVDGKNADQIILKAIFESNCSSLSQLERMKEGLPTNLTGLFSIKQAISNSNRFFSVNSGRNYVNIGLFPGTEQTSSQDVAVRAVGRYDKFDGVHYFFRIGSSGGRILKNWPDSVKDLDPVISDDWWKVDNKEAFDKLLFIDKYELPENIENYSYIICRANHPPPKWKLYEILKILTEKNINIIFTELSQPIALYLYLQINLLNDYQNLDIICPIVTNTFRTHIPGKGNARLLKSFNKNEKLNDNLRKLAWWSIDDSPVKNIKDLFRACRYYDSTIFWNEIERNKQAFLNEVVKWSHNLVLTGGYLSLHIALQSPRLRKLVIKRLLIASHLLKATCIKPVSESMRYITNELQEKVLPYEGDKAATLYTADVIVSKSNVLTSLHKNGHSRATKLPVFQYPNDKIISSTTWETYKGKYEYPSALCWLNDLQINVNKDEYFTGKISYYSRLGSTEKIRKKKSENLTIHSKQPPDKAYRVWQTHKLINIGHYSYMNHHYYVWLDLFGFIGSRTADSNNMLRNMVSYIEKLKPSCILYCQNDDSEALISMLRQTALITQAQHFPRDERIWPVVASRYDCYIGTKEIGAVLNDHDIDLNKSLPVIFLDDAMVTGKTIREIKSCLSRSGFHNFYSLVLLDRTDPSIEIQENLNDRKINHFSWWSIAIPPTGDNHTCKICKGIEKLKYISKATKSSTIYEILNNWTSLWDKKDNLFRFENKLKKDWLKEEIFKKLGNYKQKNIILKNSEAVCTWALDMMNRLDYYDYLFYKDHPEIEKYYTEVLSGLVFMHWSALDIIIKSKILSSLVDKIWSEKRDSARGLIAVATSSLNDNELSQIKNIIEQKIISDGIGNIDCGVFLYIVSNLSKRNQKDKNLLEKLNAEFPDTTKLEYGDKYNKTKSILHNLLHCDDKRNIARNAIQRIGFPGRGVRHYYVFKVLSELSKTTTSPLFESDKINEVRLILEPVRNLMKERKNLFKKYDIYDELVKVFKQFDFLCDPNPKTIKDTELLTNISYFRKVINKLYKFLATDVHGKPHVRSVLGLEYIHYLPYFIKYEINNLLKNSEFYNKYGYVKNGFQVTEPKLETDQIFFSGLSINTLTISQIEELQKNDVVFIERVHLVTVIHDLLYDIKHPIKDNDRLPSGYFMQIDFEKYRSPDQEKNYYVATFANVCKKSNYKKSSGRSWQIIKSIIKDYYGLAKSEYDEESCVLKRKIFLPYYEKVQDKEVRYAQPFQGSTSICSLR